jgi:plasmid stabilization system protein ParE
MKSRYEIDISNAAISDLAEIRDYLRVTTPGDATLVLERISKSLESLERFPDRFFRMRKHRRGPHVRCAPASGYHIALVMEGRLVRVLRIYRATRKPPKIEGK